MQIEQSLFKQIAQINYQVELKVTYNVKSKELKQDEIEEIDYNIVNYIFDYIYREYPVLACIGFQQVRHASYPQPQYNFYTRREEDAMLMELPIVSLLQKLRISTKKNLFSKETLIKHSNVISENLTDNNSYEHKKASVLQEDINGKKTFVLGDNYELKNLLYLDEKNSSEGLDHLIKLHAPKYFYIVIFDASCQNINFVQEQDKIMTVNDLYVFKLVLENQKANILQCFNNSKAKMKQRKSARFAQVKAPSTWQQDLDQQMDKQLDYIQQFAQVDGQIGYSISLVDSSELFPEDYMVFKTDRIVATDYAFFYVPTNMISSNIYNSIFACQPRVIKDFFENDDGTEEEDEKLLIQMKLVDENSLTKKDTIQLIKTLVENAKMLIRNKIEKYIESIEKEKNDIQEEVYIDIPINTVLITLTKYDQVSMEVKAPKEFQKVKTQSYLYDGRVYKKDPSLKIKLNAKESILFMSLLQEVSYRLDTKTKITFDPTEPEEKYLYLVGPQNIDILIEDLVKTLNVVKELFI